MMKLKRMTLAILTGLAALASSACPDLGGSQQANNDGIYLRCINNEDPQVGNGSWQPRFGEDKCGAGVTQCYVFTPPAEVTVCLNEEDGFVIGDSIESRQDLILDACVEKCDRSFNDLSQWDEVSQQIAEFPKRCETEGFTGEIQLQFGAEVDELTCVRERHRNADVDGSDIVWDVGPADRDGVDCDLNQSCCGEFTADICPLINQADLTSNGARGGDYLGVTPPGASQLALDFPDPVVGADADDTHTLYVEGEYTAHPCDGETCPFYLGHLFADGGGAVWEIKIEQVVRKDISNLEVQLMQPVMGLWSPLDGSTAFQDEALALRVQFDVEGPIIKTDDGHYDVVATNSGTTIGTYNNGNFTLVTEFPIDDGTGTLTLELAPELSPPVAQVTLPATLECNAPGAWLVDGSINTSFDPDGGDLLNVVTVDGAFANPGTPIPLGVHTFSVRSENDRLAATLADPVEAEIVDTTPPEVTLPDPIELECNAVGGIPAADGEIQAWLDSAGAFDICQGDINGGTHDAPDFFPSGCPAGTETFVAFSFDDGFGNVSEQQSSVTVVDTTAPVVTPPAPIVLECNSQGGVPADDPEVVAWINSASAVDICNGSIEDLDNDAPALFEYGCPPGNATTVHFTATDCSGNNATDESTVTVQDTTPPMVECAVAHNMLWPPNHQMVDVGLTFGAFDVCDEESLDFAVTVTSDEDPSDAPGAGGQNHCSDAVVADDFSTVHLRAERSGSGNGRVYEISVTATDACGNVGLCQVQVMVPRTGQQQPATDSGQAFDAESCND